MATFDNFVCAAMIQWDFGQKTRYIKAKLFSLAELRVEEYVAKFTNCARSQLTVALFYIGEVSQCSRDLDQNHGFALSRAVKFKYFADREWKECYHFIVDWFGLHLFVRMREAFNRSDGVVEQVKHFVVVSDGFVCNSLR